MYKNSLESSIKDFLIESEDLNKSKSSRSDWRRFIKQPVNPDLLKPSPAHQEKKQKEEEEEELASMLPNESSGMSSQTFVSGLDPSKKLIQLVFLSKGKPVRESFIREHVIFTLQEIFKNLSEDSFEDENKKFWEKMKAMDAQIAASQQRINNNIKDILNPAPLTQEQKDEVKRSVDAQVELAQIEGRKQANAGGKANVDIRTGKRKEPINTGRFGVENGQLVDYKRDREDKRTMGQKLAFDRNTQRGLDAQMDAAKQRSIERRNAKRRELGMSELNPNSPEMTGRPFKFDRSRLSDPTYRQEAIRQINDTRTPNQKRQDRERDQTLDAVRRGGQAKQDAISRFNQSLEDMKRKSEITRKDWESQLDDDNPGYNNPNAPQERAERKEQEHKELLQDPRMASAADRVQAKLDARFGKGKVSIR